MPIFNYSAGPSMLPHEVMQDVQEELLSYEGSGVSIVEMSHRSTAFQSIVESLEARLRRLMDIPETYAVLFLQGGATLQFSMVPMNLRDTSRFAYVDTGIWSKKAMADARCFGEVAIIQPTDDLDGMSFSPDALHDVDYVHLTLNNTIEGTRFTAIPETEVPIVADASSNILAESIDVSRFGLIYAGAQKNIGPSGLTVVIVRRDLVRSLHLPSYLSYHNQMDTLLNTPSTFSMYVAERVLKWVEEAGGVEAMERMNVQKRDLIYGYFETSALFKPLVTGEKRSLTNIPFTTGSEETDQRFLEFAREQGLIELGGHRSVGGLRASLYNAMPLEGATRLIEVMRQFEEGHDVSH